MQARFRNAIFLIKKTIFDFDPPRLTKEEGKGQSTGWSTILDRGGEKSPNNNADRNYRTAGWVEITRKLRRCNAGRRKGGDGIDGGRSAEGRRQRSAQSCLGPSAACQDDGAATLDRSAARDGKRGPCQPTGATC